MNVSSFYLIVGLICCPTLLEEFTIALLHLNAVLRRVPLVDPGQQITESRVENRVADYVQILLASFDTRLMMICMFRSIVGVNWSNNTSESLLY